MHHADPLVEHDERRNALRFGRDQRACQLHRRKLGLRCNQDQHLVDVGGKRFGADFVLPVQQVAALVDALDHALSLGVALLDNDPALGHVMRVNLPEGLTP